MRRSLLIVALAALMVMAFGASAAFAGEWNRGHFNAPGGDLPAKYHANSECLFNGLDQPDDSSFGAGDGEPWFAPVIGGDDGLWGLTPAKGKVQSGGQMIAALKQGVALPLPPEETPFPGVQRFACNGHTNPLK